MMKYVAPLQGRLRHLRLPPRKHPTAFTHHQHGDEETPKTSQLLAEHAAAIIGSWRFLIVQACVLATWVLVNALRIAGFDPQPFILLNLLLSFQAAFTGPVLLIAANVGALRDHQQFARMERLIEQNKQIAEQNEQLTEQLAALVAAQQQQQTPKPAPATPRRKATA